MQVPILGAILEYGFILACYHHAENKRLHLVNAPMRPGLVKAVHVKDQQDFLAYKMDSWAFVVCTIYNLLFFFAYFAYTLSL